MDMFLLLKKIFWLISYFERKGCLLWHSVFRIRGTRVYLCGRLCCYCCSVTQSCLTLCDPVDCSMPGLPVHHQPEITQTCVHWVRCHPTVTSSAGLYGISISVFKGISILFSLVAVLVCIPTNSVRGFPFSTPSPAFIACRLLDCSHSDWCEMVPHSGFDLHFSDNEWCWASFPVFVSHLYVFFGEMSI